MINKTALQRNLMLLPGWRTKRKIVVIESDDWGSIRMPDNETRKALSNQGSAQKSNAQSEIDSLESNDDISALYDVLTSVKDINRKSAIFTANTIVANPDFEKIEDSGYREYHYEKFSETLKRYPNRDNVMSLITQGMSDGFYKPQFHGREHLNVNQWLKALQSNNLELIKAFKYRTFGINLSESVSKRKNLMAALDFDDPSEIEEKKQIVRDGISIFEEIFGFKSKSFIAPCYHWDTDIEKELLAGGIRYIQGIPFQLMTNPSGEKYKKKFHYTGQKNKQGQIYLVRNAFFEPGLNHVKNANEECLKRIELAFKWGKPAIIGSHRVNFIGSINEENRKKNLELLKLLLKTIVFTWPNVEFLSSDQLGDLIKS